MPSLCFVSICRASWLWCVCGNCGCAMSGRTFWEFALAGNALLDLLDHVSLRVVWVHAGKFLHFLKAEESLPALFLERVFDIVAFAGIVDPRESMAAVPAEPLLYQHLLPKDRSRCYAAHIPMKIPPIRMSRIRKEHGPRMVPLWHIRQKIKRGVEIRQESLWIPALTPYNIRPLHRIPAKENRPVQPHKVIVPLFRVKLDRKASRIADKVWIFFTEGDGAEAQE